MHLVTLESENLMPLFRTQLPIEIKPGETLTRQNHELSTREIKYQ